ALSGLRVDGGGIHSLPPIILGAAVASAAGCLDDEHVAGLHLGLVEGPELGRGAPGALDVIAPGGTRLAPRHAVGPHQPVAREDRRGHRLEEPHAAHRAVAAAPAAAAARAL